MKNNPSPKDKKTRKTTRFHAVDTKALPVAPPHQNNTWHS